MNIHKLIVTIVTFLLFQVNLLHNLWAIDFKKINATDTRPEIWYMPTKTVPVISIKLSFPKGYAYDEKDKLGVASLVASLMDEGASDLKSDIFQEKLANNQITLNYNASQEYLTLNLNFLKFDYLTALNLASLSLFKPRFDKSMIELMRQKIINNIIHSQKNPTTLANTLFKKVYYKNHEFSNPAFGTINSLKKITQTDLKHYHKNLLKNKMFISVTGDITHKEVIEYVDILFKYAQNSNQNLKNSTLLTLNNVPKIKEQNISLYLDVPQSTIIMATPTIKRNDAQFIAYYIATHILGGGGFGSELVNNLREKNGLTYSIHALLDSTIHDGRLLIEFATANKNVTQAIEHVQNVLKNLAKKGITQEKLNQAKTYLKGQYALAFETNNDIANLAQGLYQSGLPYNYPKKRATLFNNVSLQEINQIMQKLFAQPLTKVVVGGNKYIKNFDLISMNQIEF
jgi:zinc protease